VLLLLVLIFWPPPGRRLRFEVLPRAIKWCKVRLHVEIGLHLGRESTFEQTGVTIIVVAFLLIFMIDCSSRIREISLHLNYFIEV
jgi:hypothetical protein